MRFLNFISWEIIICFFLIHPVIAIGDKKITDVFELENQKPITEDEYRARVAYAINKNWDLPEGSASVLNSKVRSFLGFTINRRGDISDISFIERSGYEPLDRSAYEAIEKSIPVQSIPASIKKNSIKMGLYFTPNATGGKNVTDIFVFEYDKPVTEDEYRTQVAYEINKNWTFPEGGVSAPNTKARCSLIFIVTRSGEIIDIEFTERSGHETLDRSAYEAIKKSIPVQSIPASIKKDSIRMGLRFTPKGMN